MVDFQTYVTGKDEVKAIQWHTNGDHPLDQSAFVQLATETDGEPDIVLSEGQVVRKFRHPYVPGRSVCELCGYVMYEHGLIVNSGEDSIVCPGDYVVTNALGDTFPTKPVEFNATYRPK